MEQDKRKGMMILGDSSVLPRESEGILLQDTYPILLQKRFKVDIDACYGKTTSSAMVRLPLGFKPEYFVIHLGLVDCFPRLFSDKQKRILSYFPDQLRRLIIYPMTKYRYQFTKVFPKTNIDLKTFEENVSEMIQVIKRNGMTPIIVDILHVSKEIEKRNYGVNGNIFLYNKILSRLAFYHDCSRVRLNYMTRHHPDMLHTDGQHLSKLGHVVLYNLILAEIHAGE